MDGLGTGTDAVEERLNDTGGVITAVGCFAGGGGADAVADAGAGVALMFVDATEASLVGCGCGMKTW